MACSCSALTTNRRRLVSNQRFKRGDPTRTLAIQRRWIADNQRRAKALIQALVQWLVTDDALGLKNAKKTPLDRILNVEREFQFLSDPGKLEAFNAWFKQQVEADILSPAAGAIAGQPWTTDYIESSYKRGVTNAFAASRDASGGARFDAGQQAFIQEAFNQPETLSKIQLLAQRSFENLKGVTATMSSQMNQILAQGIADGRGPRELAKEMSEKIASLTRSRANTIARTEIIHAHAEGQLDSYERLGIDELGLFAEWSTAGDDRVCPDCFAREGQVFTVEEARNLIPLHPNCRCTWIPSLKGPKGKTPTRRRAPAARPAPAAQPVIPTVVPGAIRQQDLVSNMTDFSNFGPAFITKHSRSMMRQIDEVHPLPTAYIPKPEFRQAKFNKGNPQHADASGVYSPGVRNIQVKKGLTPGETKVATAHEFGHYIDDAHLGNGITYGSEMAWRGTGKLLPQLGDEGVAIFKKLMVKLNSSAQVKELKSAALVGKYGRPYVSYITSRKEIFARAYSQYIAGKTGDPDMAKFFKKLLAERNDKHLAASQWTKDVMDEVTPLFDDLFKAMETAATQKGR